MGETQANEQDTDSSNEYDVVIVGGGPAGLTAAVYTARQGLSTAIVAGEVGGQAVWAGKVENYLGFELIPGADLVRLFREHISRFDVTCIEGELVNAIVPAGGGFEVYTREGSRLVGRGVIIASGRAPSRLSVPGEKELIGRGVSYCSTCDGAFFRGRPVAVAGGGEPAVEAALQMAALDARVVLVSEKPLRAGDALMAKLRGEPRIEVREGWKVTRVEGDEHVAGIVVRMLGSGRGGGESADRDAAAGGESGGRGGAGEAVEESLAVEAVFVEKGSIPAEEFTGGLVKVNRRGEIEVGKDAMTSHPGVFAAGDITDDYGRQIIIAAGEGARAGMGLGKWLRGRRAAPEGGEAAPVS